jgi:PAS domain S-box-containing protein
VKNLAAKPTISAMNQARTAGPHLKSPRVSPLRILHLEDDPKDAELVRATLEGEGLACDVTRVETPTAFRTSLEQGGFDLILVDYTLPSFDGISALKLAKEVSPDVPFIFVSGTLGEEVMIEALKLGATDYVSKTRLSRMAPSVRRALRETSERLRLQLAERTLRESEAYLAEAQRLSQTGSWAWSPVTGDIRYWSEECYRVLGFDPAEAPPRFETFFQRIHTDDQASTRERFEKAIREKTDFEMDYRIVHPCGETRNIHVVGHAVLGRSGELAEFVGTVIDVTERKRAEQTLRQSEAYLAEAQKLSQTGSWAWSPDTDIRYWSEECYRVLGFDPRDGLPRMEELIRRIHPDDQPAFRESANRAKHKKLDEEVDYRIVYPGGAVRDIHSIGHPVFSPSGDLVEFMGTVIDITERKRAEEELQQLVDLVPQMSVVLGPDGKWMYANRVALEYTGLTLDEFLSLDVIGRVVHPDDVEKVRAARERGLAGSDPFEFDARQLGKDGIYRWFLVRYNPLVEEGRVRRWYVSATEIESRKQEEERIRQENVRLEERTRIAQELHDTLLQTFLSASMQLSVAVDGVPSEAEVKPLLDRVLRIMKQGIEEGRNTIEDLRSTDLQPFDLVTALSDVRQELGVNPEVDFRVSVDGKEQALQPHVRYEIYRIGREALINAFSHSRANRVEFKVEYADDDFRMCIWDNGRGIHPEVLRNGRGGHWGLAGMRERATRIGGILKISSNADGTEVQLSVPGALAFQVAALNQSA